jgi:hypothetical protein
LTRRRSERRNVMGRRATIATLVALLVSAGPTAVLAQDGSGNDRSAAEPYGFCLVDGYCDIAFPGVDGAVSREEMKAIADTDPSLSVVFPDEDESIYLVCAEGQGCDWATKDVEVDTEAERREFTAQSDASPVGTWSVTFDDTVLECSTGSEEVEAGTVTVKITETENGGVLFDWLDIPRPTLTAVRLGWGTYGLLDRMVAGTDKYFLTMSTMDSFTGTRISELELPGSGTTCDMNTNLGGVRVASSATPSP